MNKLGFGFLRLPKTDQPVPNHLDWEEIMKMTDLFLEAGHDYFDTAYVYLEGWSERGLKKCLVERYPRDSFRIVDKLPGYECTCYEDNWKFFYEQLELCGVEYFDRYMLHWMNTKHYAIAEKLDQFRFLEEVKEKGLAKEIGFSFHDDAETLDRILTDHPNVDFVQIQLNFLDWESESVQSQRLYDVCVKHGKPIVVMEPVKGGTLAKLPEEAEQVLREVHPDWSNADWALRFASSQPQVEIVLSGMNNSEQMAQNLRPFEPLNEEETQALNKVVSIINANTAIPCTGCRYCTSHCPKGILIPDYFRLYNELMRYTKEEWKVKTVYNRISKENGKAADCIACGACAMHCPQKIAIPEFMKTVAEEFGKTGRNETTSDKTK